MTLPPRRIDVPRQGAYLLRLVKNGPLVGAVILRRDGAWHVMVDGDWLGPSVEPWPTDWPEFLAMMERVHIGGRPSDDAEVQFRIGKKRWAMIHEPTNAAANPKRAINRDTAVPF